MITEILTGAGLVTASKIKEDSFLGMVYKDSLQPSVQLVGKALGSVLEFSTIPFKYIQLANDKVKLNIDTHLTTYQDKLKQTPLEDIIEVNPQIGVPILDKLSYTTNQDIAALFINLLVNASSSKTVNTAHPSFITLIENLSIDEARIIKNLVDKDFIPYINFVATLKEPKKGFLYALTTGTMLAFETDLLFPENILMYQTNLERLGIVYNQSEHFKQDESIYLPLLEKHNFEINKEGWLNSGHYKSFEFNKGYYNITPFGKQFINACIDITEPTDSQPN